MFEILMSSNGTSAAAAGAFFGLYGMFMALYCFMALVALAFFVIWVWMLIDCLKRENYKDKNDKLLWVVVIVFTGIIGAAIYYFLVKKKLDK